MDDIINIKRKGASLNLFNLESSKENKMENTNINTNIKSLNYQDLFDYVKSNMNFNGSHYVFSYTNKNINVTLKMRSIKSIADYLFRYHNDTNVYCISYKN